MTAYLDHAATTPLRPEARVAMEPWLGGRYGNPSGSHSVARAARAAVDEARDVVAHVLGTAPGDVVFTSGGTEAANLAVLGRVRAAPGPLVVSAIEHHCVLNAALAAERHGSGEARVVGVGKDGVMDLAALSGALDRSVSLVSVQLVNNEVGTLQPFDEVARLVRRRSPGAVLHTDAVQAVPWYDVSLLAAQADIVSISAHKFGGPQGAGALAFRRPVRLEPLFFGGPQERERRAGTHNVAGIVGLAAALVATLAERESAVARVGALRKELCAGLLAGVPGSRETAPGQEKAPGHCHLVIEGIESEALLMLLDGSGVAASAGSACASGAMEPSHVLRAMGYSEPEAMGALRLTLGHTTTAEEVRTALRAVPEAVERLRAGGGRPNSAGGAPGAPALVPVAHLGARR
ncbi:MAG: cysteine desulfurase family protein [Actinomycetota bacterium]|nr:cysteine desulfurase family protein [Actinomycetota bacterium]